MNKLVLHHTYFQGMAFDVSDHRNHGRLADVTPGSGDFAGTFVYDRPTSRIAVRPSRTLADLHAVWAWVRFRPAAPVGPRRQNLIEGFVSFALVIGEDGSLGAAIVDASGNWNGAGSAPGLITADTWHEAELRHDGISQLTVLLDGAVVARSDNVPGPVRSVGPLGVAIGTWPDQDDVFTFRGHLDEVRLYRYDPVDDIRRYLDPCCLDVRRVRATAERLRTQGWDPARLGQVVARLMQLAGDLARAVRAGDPTRTDEHQAALVDLARALAARDEAALRPAVGRLIDLTRSVLSQNEIDERTREAARLIGSLPLPPEELEALAASLCWQHMLIRNPRSLLPPG